MANENNSSDDELDFFDHDSDTLSTEQTINSGKAEKQLANRRHQCNECMRVFPYGYKLKEHKMRTHSPLKEHIICVYGNCKQKGIRLGGKQAYFGHVERFHPEIKTSKCVIRYVYPLPKNEFATISTYTYDKKEKKPSEERDAFEFAYNKMLMEYGDSIEANDIREDNRRALSVSQTISIPQFKAHLLSPTIQSGKIYYLSIFYSSDSNIFNLLFSLQAQRFGNPHVH